MTEINSLVLFNGSFTAGRDLFRSSFCSLEGDAGLRSDIFRHYSMLSGVTPAAQSAYPIMFLKTGPADIQTASSSRRMGSEASRKRYAELVSQLRGLDTSDDDLFEKGAVETAVSVIEQFSKTNLAPPELSWMGSEAIIMLWMLGNTKYALTVTDGEVGYVVRADGKTLRRDHGILLANLDTLHLS